MGGPGSGRKAKKNCTSDLKRLDVRRLQQEGLLTPGRSFSLSWARGAKDCLAVTAQTDDDRLVLSYRHRRNNGQERDLQYSVPLSWSACHLGGRRVWFLCPAKGCGRRVAILYLGNAGIFACRHCYRLVYRSQRQR